MSDTIRKLASRLLHAEVAAKNPRDVNAVIDAISTRIRFDNDGEIFVVDRNGQRDHSKTFDGFLTEVQRDRPELFSKSGATAGDGNANPFRKGSGFSITNQMLLMKSNPELAKQYEEEAKS